MQGVGRYVWAGLDLLTFLRSLLHLTLTINLGLEGLSNRGVFEVITRDLFILSLLFSAYFTFREKKLGFWIYMVQLPVRVYFYAFSFNCLNDMPMRYYWEHGELFLVIVIPALELFRIWYWVKVLRSDSSKTFSSTRSRDLLADELS